MPLDDGGELATIDGFKKLAEDGRRKAHAPFLFLSLDNQKIAGKPSVLRGMRCDLLNQMKSSPDSRALRGRRGASKPDSLACPNALVRRKHDAQRIQRLLVI